MGQTLSSYGKNLRQGLGWQKSLAILPLPLLIAIIIMLAFINPALVFEPPFLLPILNVLFLSLIPFTVAYLAWKSYATSGTLTLFLVGCGMVALGSGSLVAGFIINIPGGTNLNVTIFNSGALIFATLLVAGALFALQKATPYKSPKHGGLYLGLCYLAVLIFMSLFSLAALAGLVPPFFVQGAGPTVLRQVVLGAATVLFAVATIIFLRVYLRSRYDFTYWFSLALALITIGLCAVFIQKSVGSPIGWTGRVAQYLGCAYLLIGIISAARLSDRKSIPLEKEITRSFNYIVANYKTLVEMASDAIISVDRQSCVLSWNQAAEKIFGYKEREILGVCLLELVFSRESSNLLATEMQKLSEVKDNLLPGKTIEITANRKGGELFPAEISFAARKVYGDWIVTFIIRDMTERKRAEEALLFTRFSLDNAIDTMSCVDRDARFVNVNESFCRATGYSREELLSMRVHDIDPDYSADVWPEFWEKLKQSGSLNFETTHRTRDGRSYPVEITANYFEYNGKEYHTGFARDITERKQAEEALRESESKYRSLVETAGAGVASVDLQGNLTFVNNTFIEMMGYTREDLAGKPLLNFIHPGDRKQVQDKFLLGLEKPEDRPDLEFRALQKNGNYIWLYSSPTPLIVEGNLIGFTAIATDITDRKNKESELLATHDQLRNLAARLQMTREDERKNIAVEIHDDLGQSLTALQIDLSWLIKRMPHDQKKLLEKAESMLRLVKVTDEKAREIATELRPPLLDDLGFVPAAQSYLSEFEEKTGITCDFFSEPEGIILDANVSIALFRVLQGTLINTAKHAKATRIKLSLAEQTDGLYMKISDNGRGITQKEIASRKSIGILGMRERIAYIGGSLQIEGRPGKGTTVKVKIPVQGDMFE